MNPPSTPTAAAPPRRWPRFRLRTALWLLLVCALCLGWWSDRQRLAEDYRRAELLREARRMASVVPTYESYASVFGGGPIRGPEGDWEEEHATVEPLERYGLASNTQFLLQALAGHQGPSANGAAPAGRPPYEQRVAELVAALSEPDPQRRARAARTLALPAWREPAAVPALIRALSDPQRVVRWHAVYALGQFGPDAAAAAPHLREMVHDQGCDMSAFAAQMLLNIDPSADLGPRLVALLDDQQADTRRRAAAALAVRGGPIDQPATDRLLALLADEDPKVRRAACTAVARLLPRETALDALLAAFQDEKDSPTRGRIARELTRLDGEAK